MSPGWASNSLVSLGPYNGIEAFVADSCYSSVFLLSFPWPDNGIAVTALHGQMLTESPGLFFIHFWVHDEALKLAHGLRAALDKINSAK